MLEPLVKLIQREAAVGDGGAQDVRRGVPVGG